MICPACNRQNSDGARFCSGCGALLAVEAGEGLVGQTIGGRYAVRRVLGEGGMGVVYEAEQRMGSHLRKVAIKTLLPELSRDHTLVSRFYRECGTVSQLEHPNTIRFYDFGETPDGALFIAMEFASGVPLTEAIAKGPMPVARTLKILRQVCGALHEAHNLGIVHRDLKPDNVFLTDRAGEHDFVKLLDFGIAARTGPSAERQTKLTEQGTVLGTPPYMSPEQLTGKSLDGRSDIYSLGVIAFEMLTGHLPFQADSPWQWAQKHMTESPRPLDTFPALGIPHVVAAAVMRALAKRPEDRPATAQEFYRELCGGVIDAGFVNLVAPETQGPRTSPMGAPPPMRQVSTEDEQLVPMPQVRTASAMAAPVAPPPMSHRRGSWGWFVAGAGLLGAAAVAAAVVLHPQTQAPAPPLSGGDTGAPLTTVAPLIDTSLTPTSEPPVTPVQPVKPAPKPGAKPPTTAPSATTPGLPLPFPPTTPSTTPPAPSTTPPAPSTTPPPPSSGHVPQLPPPGPKPPQLHGDAACAAASGMAGAGNIQGAVALYNQCRSTGGSAAAQSGALSRIRSNAPAAVRTRAFRGDCAGAQSIVSAAASVGAGGPAQTELKKDGC